MLAWILVPAPEISVYNVATQAEVDAGSATQGIKVAATAGAVTLTPLLGYGAATFQTHNDASALLGTLTEALKRTGHLPLAEGEVPPPGGVSLARGFRLEFANQPGHVNDSYVDFDEEAVKYTIKAGTSVLHVHDASQAFGVRQALLNLGVQMPAPPAP